MAWGARLASKIRRSRRSAIALRSFHVMAVEYHASVPAEGSGAMADPLPMAAVVHHRESLMGCHSFEQFLSPRWETLLVFEDTFAHTWRLDRFVPRPHEAHTS